jgi:hypothetical protein
MSAQCEKYKRPGLDHYRHARMANLDLSPAGDLGTHHVLRQDSPTVVFLPRSLPHPCRLQTRSASGWQIPLLHVMTMTTVSVAIVVTGTVPPVIITAQSPPQPSSLFYRSSSLYWRSCYHFPSNSAAAAKDDPAAQGVWGYLTPKRSQALVARESAVAAREAEVACREAELLVDRPTVVHRHHPSHRHPPSSTVDLGFTTCRLP